MHYDQFAFAKDRKIPTIYSKTGSTLGNTVGFTQVKMHIVNQIRIQETILVHFSLLNVYIIRMMS
jgi:hypothetical protein